MPMPSGEYEEYGFSERYYPPYASNMVPPPPLSSDHTIPPHGGRMANRCASQGSESVFSNPFSFFGFTSASADAFSEPEGALPPSASLSCCAFAVCAKRGITRTLHSTLYTQRPFRHRSRLTLLRSTPLPRSIPTCCHRSSNPPRPRRRRRPTAEASEATPSRRPCRRRPAPCPLRPTPPGPSAGPCGTTRPFLFIFFLSFGYGSG
jgi:hypothetical protein